MCNKCTISRKKAVNNSFDKLKKIILVPDSLNVYDCISRDFSKDKNNDSHKEIMVYIHFSSKNKGGGITESEYIFACDKKGNVIEWMDVGDIEKAVEEGTMSELIMDYDNYVFYGNLNGWDKDFTIYTDKEIKRFLK